MIEIMDKSTEDVIGIKTEGHISVNQFHHVLPHIEKAVEDHDKIKLLILVKSMEGYGLKEFEEDVKFAIKYWDHILKLAIVSDRSWWGTAAKVDNLFTKWEERYFDVSELDKAWEWVKS